MPFKIDVRDGESPVRWAVNGDGVRAVCDDDYRPALYAGARGDRTRYLDWLESALERDPKVTDLRIEEHFRTLAATERSPLLRIEVERIGDVRRAAREIREREHADHAPGVVTLYDVDLDPQFRYCLDTGRDPHRPSEEAGRRPLRRLSLSLSERARVRGDLTALRIDGERISADAGDGVRDVVTGALAERDPDVLVLSTGELVPALADVGVDLGRRPGYARLAGESTYVSYGQVGYSPARYDVPGRVLVDESNSFLLQNVHVPDGSGGGESDVEPFPGLQYLVERAGKPLQEVARDSIGGVLTAVEVRKARERDVLAPWQKRQTERWKSLDTLHDADRGGHSFQPEVGLHEDVHELDFASLYPNVMREYNVSPETVCCDCCDTEAVPELGYSVCENRTGFLGAVLGPLLDDRADWKRELRESDPSPARAAVLEARADAVKWVLVSCFGYQGYRHAKFGRIETHEAINAYARDILLSAKERLEDAGWVVLHGIVDSVWVTADPGREQRPIRDVAAEISAAARIDLEYEGRFDWVAFCPRKRASGGAIMRYFGKWGDRESDGDAYKFRGIEARQRSTCAFVAAAQRDLVAALDRERSPAGVVDRLVPHLARVRRGDVDPASLAIRQRVSKPAGEYRQSTRARDALVRAERLGVTYRPGQSVEYVVADDDAAGPERVRLAFEDDGSYDPEFYADRLVAACESVVAPFGWDDARVRRRLRDTRDATLTAFDAGG